MTQRLPAIQKDPIGRHQATILMLHGLGADGHDVEPIIDELGLPETLGVRFILPHAPRRPVTINSGSVMRAWYDISHNVLGRKADLSGIEETLRSMDVLINEELAQGILPRNLLIAGFSQGGVIALEAMSRFQEKVGGAIALSAYLAREEGLPEAHDPKPVFIAHGTEDPIVPFALGLQAKEDLVDKGYRVDWHHYSMPHSMCQKEIEDIRGWIVTQLQST